MYTYTYRDSTWSVLRDGHVIGTCSTKDGARLTAYYLQRAEMSARYV